MPFDFPLTVDALDAIPEKYRALYVEEDGEIKLEGDLFSKIDKLAKTIDKERKRAKDAERDAKSWGDVGGSPDEVKAKLEEIEGKHAEEIAKLQKLIDEKGDSAGKIEKIKKELEKASHEAISKKDEELRSMEGTLRVHLMESAAKAAIAEEKGRVKPLLPYVLNKLSFVKDNGKYDVRVLDEDGEVRLTKDGRDMGIRELVQELKADQDFSALFEGSGTTGSGSSPKGSAGGSGSAQKNPWAKDTFNLTEQMKLTQESPALAAKLKAQA
jgi:myosin heavy subunit